MIWALASGATVVAAGAAATYWVHPDLLWPDSAPAVVSARVSEPPPARVAAQPAEESAPASAPSASTSSAVAATEVEAPHAAPTGEPAAGVAAPSASTPPESRKPAFDVVNVAPTGETVVAGRAAPNAKVELRDSGRTVAEATADPQGQFVMVPPALPPGDHSLSLATGSGKSSVETSKAISVSVPAPEAKTEVATATPTEKAASPAATPLAIPAPAAPSRVAIQSVEALEGGALAAKGAADADSNVRLSINGVFVANAQTKADGRWSLTVQHGMSPGAYVVRADETRPADAKVVASAEAAFAYPAAQSLARPSAPSPAPSLANAKPTGPAPAVANAGSPIATAVGGPSTADVVVESITTDRVVRGDTLWGISRTFYGDGRRYPLIFGANANQIHNPNLIYPGESLVVPKADSKP